MKSDNQYRVARDNYVDEAMFLTADYTWTTHTYEAGDFTYEEAQALASDLQSTSGDDTEYYVA